MREWSWIERHLDFPLGSVLEVGCGNGLIAARVAAEASRVVASDLPFFDPRSHALGLTGTRQLLAEIHPNTSVLGCSGAALPIRDESIDTVISLYSLEHIAAREAAVAEVARVLRPGGNLVAAVPAAPTSWFYPFAFYAELGRRAFRRALGRVGRAGAAEASSDQVTASAPVVTDLRSFRAAYPRFPAPSPHGEYDSFVDEFHRQHVGRWEALMEQHGLRVIRTVPMSVVPVQLLLAVAGGLGERLHAALEPIDQRICARPIGRPLAQSVCVIARRPT
jgi:SAM-dependent methyltransferase